MSENESASDLPDLTESAVAARLRGALDHHGYGFQYATLKRCLKLQQDEALGWHFVVSEFPVTPNDHTSHIDFILAWRTHLLVAECKRTRDFTWGFARGLAAIRSFSAFRPRADYLYWHDDKRLAREAHYFSNGQRPPYEVAVPIKTPQSATPKGTPRDKRETQADDQKGNQRNDFENAVTQVMRARSGLMDKMTEQANLRYGGGMIIPVIFTTTSLAVADIELSEANIENGNLPHPLGVREVDWLWYDSNLSSSLRSHVRRIERSTDVPTKTEMLQQELARDSRRSVAVVTPGGIEPFLSELAASLAFAGEQVR
jgi:hypothetical protein